jgi:hypothetical protein
MKNAVIPGRAKREPGIHNRDLGLWIPGPRQEAHPGMTRELNEEYRHSGARQRIRAKRGRWREPGIQRHAVMLMR